ncbi:MAG: DNA-binding protein [Thermodesulfobacteria bacterium]|nr:DNA-binding protein [Thermodesulfobacteriota bacterium]
MKYSKGNLKRIFTVRLEDGDIVHECLEELARREGIRAAAVIAVGGADTGSTLVVGPEKGRGQLPVSPQKITLDDVHEVVGTGTIFPDEDGNPLIHMHMACGRNNETVTGCIREGVKTWHIIEAIVFEIEGASSIRKLDTALGFKLLEPEGD